MLILASKTFLSHKHNAIVNRHRQNALMTFNALAAATKEDAAKDVILTHARGCIFCLKRLAMQKGKRARKLPRSCDGRTSCKGRN